MVFTSAATRRLPAPCPVGLRSIDIHGVAGNVVITIRSSHDAARGQFSAKRLGASKADRVDGAGAGADHVVLAVVNEDDVARVDP